MSRTPRLDAVMCWIAAGRIGEIDWPVEHPDPYAGMTDAERLEHVVRHCGAGVMAELPRRTVVVDGRRIPIPPGGPYRHGRRNHAPKPRAHKREAPT